MEQSTLKRVKGRPCRRGHGGWRYFAPDGRPGNCCECMRLRKRAMYQANPALKAERNARGRRNRNKRLGRFATVRQKPPRPWLHPDGYVRGRFGSTGKLVAVHTVVMENHLGRLLRKPESVHHKNGNRSDNRLENLELWSRSQPAGQRVEDKLAWAREIIALYGSSW
jgi:hypothetical protein